MANSSNSVDLLNELERLVQCLDRMPVLLRDLAPMINQQCQIEGEELKSLRTRFLIVVVLLLIMMTGAILAAVILLLRPEPVVQPDHAVWAALFAGFAGSTMAALRSALDRRAQGFESRSGKQWPDPWRAKERFSEAMSYWFIGRPFFGIPMGALAYWVLAGNLIGCTSDKEASPMKVAVGAFVAGLFAKTIIEILLKTTKEVFHVEG